MIWELNLACVCAVFCIFVNTCLFGGGVVAKIVAARFVRVETWIIIGMSGVSVGHSGGSR